MLLPSEGVSFNEQILTLLEGHLIQRRLRVVSSAITGRVVLEPLQGQGAEARSIEGPAKLSNLERALVLAKRSNVECVFQMNFLRLDRLDVRWFSWFANAGELTEVPEQQYNAAPAWRRWYISGPEWELGGKVVDVETGNVLAVIQLTHSAVRARPTQTFSMSTFQEALAPQGQGRGWNLSNEETATSALRQQFMGELATQVEGN